MANLHKGGEHFLDQRPLRMFLLQRAAAFIDETVVLAFTASGLVALPSGGDEFFGFEPVEDGVKGSFGPFDFATGAFANFLNNGVTVGLPFGEDAEKERPEGGGD